MSDVTFNEPNYGRDARTKKKASVLSRLIMGMDLAKNEKEAQRVLAVAAIVIAIIAVAVYFLYGRS